MQNDTPNMDGAALPWILEHLLAYPGTYEIPLRTMYTLNASTLTQPRHQRSGSDKSVLGNAFPRKSSVSSEEQQNPSTVTAAAQLRSTLTHHITQLPTQPASLPPSFVTSFARRCFAARLDQVDFPQSLTALDYLKDLEVRRRREVVAALDKLGIEREDIGHRDKLAKKYPGVMRWVVGVEEKERKVEALYTQIYVGLRRWILINELSLTPFDKGNCVAMLNTLYPPLNIPSQQFVQPTAQLTSQVLSSQRTAFFRYITAVEKTGAHVLTNLMDQHKRPGESTGWHSLRELLDNYLRMANNVIEECFEITGQTKSPTAASFTSSGSNDEQQRARNSDLSFTSSNGSASNRDSGQSHATRPSTSSSFSTHSRKASKEKQSLAVDDDDATITQKTTGSTLERIARELRKMKSRSNIKDDSRGRNASITSNEGVMRDAQVEEPQQQAPPTPSKHGLRLRRGLMKMRSNSTMRDSSNSRPTSRSDEHTAVPTNVPAFDAEEMRRKRAIWEAQQGKSQQSADVVMEG